LKLEGLGKPTEDTPNLRTLLSKRQAQQPSGSGEESGLPHVIGEPS